MDLAELIRRNLGDRTLAQLAADCGGEPDLAGLRHLSDLAVLPAPRTIRGLARGLRVSEATVLLAAGETLGLNIDEGVAIDLTGRDRERQIPVEAWTSPEIYIAKRELRFHCENLVAVDRRLASGELINTAATRMLRQQLAGEVTAAERKLKSLLAAIKRSHCVTNL